MQTVAFVIYTPLGLQNLKVKGKRKWPILRLSAVVYYQTAMQRREKVFYCLNIKSESMQKSTKIADSWQGSKNQNRSSFADW